MHDGIDYDTYFFTGLIPAVRKAREMGQVSFAQCYSHSQNVLANPGDYKEHDCINVVGLKDAKQLVESCMALGVRRYLEDQARKNVAEELAERGAQGHGWADRDE